MSLQKWIVVLETLLRDEKKTNTLCIQIAARDSVNNYFQTLKHLRVNKN